MLMCHYLILNNSVASSIFVELILHSVSRKVSKQ